MNEHDESSLENYPHGRGYGHDYMRGGEVFGGYGYAERDEYEKPRGELVSDTPIQTASGETSDEPESQDSDIRT
jgi:hypothetical protein